jgi:1,4-dihydroxy-2-naphthoate octaprenyltransferase
LASNPLRPWLNSFNPLIYTASVIPILVGTAYAHWAHGVFDPLRFGLALVGLILVHAWINLTNDVFDWDTGVDRNKASSLVRQTQSRSQVFWIGTLMLFLGYACFWALQDGQLLAFGTLGIALGYAYQGPPLRLSYRGWGEWISASCFGPIAVLTACRAQSMSWDAGALLAGIAVGGWTATILYAHHFPQYEDDRAFGKRSPIVRWGPALAARRFWWVIAPAYAVLPAAVVTGWLPPTVSTAFLALPLAVRLVRFVQEHADKPAVVAAALPMAARYHLISGVLLTLALAVARRSG